MQSQPSERDANTLEPRVVEVKSSKNNSKVKSTPPIELYISEAEKVRVIVAHIERTAGDKIYFKLVKQQIKSIGSFGSIEHWTDTDTVGLTEDAIERLFNLAVAHAALKDMPLVRKLLVIPLLTSDETTAATDAAVAVFGDFENVKQFAKLGLPSEVRRRLVRSGHLEDMESAVDKLAALLQTEIAEGKYQTWCDAHAWAFGYVTRDNIRQITREHTADMVIRNPINPYRDLIELKRPNMKVLEFDSSHKSFYFSDEVSRAIGQCHAYLDDWSSDDGPPGGRRGTPDFYAYHPRATIVIGRTDSKTDGWVQALHGLNARMHGITVMTYDQLLTQARAAVTLLDSSPSPNKE